MRGKIGYRKELQKSYMIVSDCEKEIIEHYCGQMVLRSRIKGLAQCEMRLMDGEREIWYDISSLQTLEQAFAVKEMSYRILKDLILQVTEVVHETEQYLLDGRQLCFDPQYLYFDMESGQIKILYDFTEENKKGSIERLAEFILEKVRHEEEAAAELAYFFYDCIGKEQDFVKEIENYVEEKEGKLREEAEERAGEGEGEKAEKAAEEEQNFIAVPEEAFVTGEIPEKQFAGRETERSKQTKKSFSWESKSGRLLECGLVCIVMALLAGIALFAVRKYFVLAEREELIGAAAFALLLITGIILSVHGFAGQWKREKSDDCNGTAETTENAQRPMREEEFWEWERENEWPAPEKEESEQGKTVYIGKSLFNREYCLIETKKGIEKEYPIASYPFLIGKEKEMVNLAVKDHSVSRIHARLVEENGDIYVEDLHSTNGTYLNDLPLAPHDKVKLRRGDLLQFGRAQYVFR